MRAVFPRGLARVLALLGGFAGLATAALTSRAETGLAAAALSARSGPPGATMFKLMPPAQTGVVGDNPYADPKMWSEHYQEFVYGAIGCGVAVGDFDNDGRPDIFVVNKTGQCRLFRNLGNWKFEDVTEKAGLLESGGGWLERAKNLVGSSASAGGVEAWKQGVAFADVNNDGWLDIYVCRFGAPNLLYINQHDGTFKEEAAARGLAVVDASGMAAFCDYDRDGWLDVYIQTNMFDAAKHPKGQRDYLFHNNGDGTFTNVTDRAGIAGETCGHSVTWWDFNEDGWPDIYVSADYDTPDRLYRNNQDGTFTNVIDQVVPHTPYYSMGSDLGDVNNDGRIDLLAADMAASSHEKDFRGMAGSRERAQLPPRAGEAPQYMRSALYLNTGTGRMQEGARMSGLEATDWTWSVRFEDLDNDGRLDLHVTNGMVREFHNADLLARILSAESIPESWKMVRSNPVMKERHRAFRNLGDLRFEDVSAAWGLDQVGVGFGAAFADLDGDGDLDLVYVNYEGGVSLLRNDSDRGHRLVVALRGTRSNRFGVGATVRIETAAGPQVRQLVLARGYMSTSEPILHFGLGDDAAVKRLTVDWPSGATQTFTDIAGDQRLVITEPENAPAHPTAAVVENAAAGSGPAQFTDVSVADRLEQPTRDSTSDEPNPQPLLPETFNHRGPALAAADLDGNQVPEIVIAPTAQEPARILTHGITGSWTVREIPRTTWPASTVASGPMVIFDANGDGFNDVFVTRTGTLAPAGASDYQPILLLNDGHGGLTLAPTDALPSVAISAGAVAVADVDRDGRLDIFIGGRVLPGSYPLSPASALLINRGGRFEDVTDTLAPLLRHVGMVSSALWTDVDGDGWPDLLLAVDWGSVKCFHNQKGRGFEDWTEKLGFAAAGTGRWTSLAAADFNGDGVLDYVVGNIGLNTVYHGSPEHPAMLYYGDFAANGRPFVLGAQYEDDRLYPVQTRNLLGARVPSVLQRYRRADLYARATLPEIVGADRLAAAQRFAATELRSGVFLSQPDGTYRFEPLPRIAQIAPLQGMVAGDFDGDGAADIYAVQNSFAPVPSIGRFDGGISQLLRGDGHGHFEAVPAAESGLVVPGDAKALVCLDLDRDGWPDFVLSRNDATTLAFRNRGVPARHSLRVDLRGTRGNRQAIGARVTLELANGTHELGEIAAGSGYYSQSSSACFFGYRDGNAPQRITVRWPDGETTIEAVPAGATAVTLSQTH